MKTGFWNKRIIDLKRMIDLKTDTLHGLRLHTARSLMPLRVRKSIFNGSYESFEAEIVQTHLKPNDRVLEVGTGIGLISMLITRLTGPGQVLSYEANPMMEDAIRANFALNGLEPNLRMQAVTADGRSVTFYRDRKIVGSSIFDRGIAAEQITVPSRPIAEAMDEHRPNVLVMDVEGAETEILPAADLRGVDRIIVELHPHIVGDGPIKTLLKTLADRGFRVKKQDADTYLLTR